MNPVTPVESMLIVDDSRTQRAHAVALARELGVAAVHEAADGADALRVLGELPGAPDLMLIDLEMPGMDGIELIQQLRQLQLSVPFVVASSRERSLLGAVEEMARALGLPVLAGVRKPLTRQLLGDAIAARGRLRPSSRPDAARPQVEIDPQALAEAIAGGVIVPHYQPKVDVRSGLVRGVEVLARWPHPEHGWIPPDRFVAVAEAHGSIRALTFSVLAQALQQAAHWQARGLQFSVAVNLSPRLLDAPSLVDEICALTQAHGIEPGQLVLEITESSIAGTLGVALGVLARLRMKGFRLSIDDYGTGFASMQQLARVSFTELKVDRSFVHGAHRQRNLRVILESAIDMARRLKLVTVAEGVETMEDWQLLQAFGCDIAQGWLIAKAMPGEELPGWLKQHGARAASLRASAAADEAPR